MRHDHLVEAAEVRPYDRRLMARLLTYLAPYRRRVAAAVLLLLLSVPLELAGPWLVKLGIDRSLALRDPSALAPVALLYLAAAVLLLLVKYLQTYLTQWIGQRAIMDLRTTLFDHIQRLPLSHFDRTPVGVLLTRVGSDVDVLHELFSTGVITVAGDLAILAGIVAMMLSLNWRLALVTFTIMPLLLGLTLLFRSRVRRTFRVIRQKVAAMNAHLQESVTGMAVLQLFGREEANIGRFRGIAREHQEAFMKTIFYYSVFFPAVEVVAALGTALILYHGGGTVVAGALSFGALVAFLEYTHRFMNPLQDLAEKYNILQAAMASSERIFQLLDTPVQASTTLPSPPLPPGGTRGRLEFRGVGFAYREGDEVLREVTFTARPGEMVAFVGATGSGKTSLISLLSRLYEPQRGEILLDGRDIRSLPLSDLRRRVAIVPQEIFLFSGTVEENIVLGAAPPRQAGEVLQLMGTLPLFARLPLGLETPVGERGGILSTGQKQVLAFARALVYDPPVIVLDEATSSMDSETETSVQNAMRTLLRGRTSIVIAHRLSTVVSADRIVVLHRGEIREEGTHRDLLARRGLYWRLHQLQFDVEEEGEVTAAPGAGGGAP